MLFADAKKMTEELLKIYKLTKIFCDIADIKLLKNLIKKIVKGFTTNPSLNEKSWG